MIPAQEAAGESAMMGRQDRDQGQLFYEFSLDESLKPGVASNLCWLVVARDRRNQPALRG